MILSTRHLQGYMLHAEIITAVQVSDSRRVGTGQRKLHSSCTACPQKNIRSNKPETGN